MTFVIFSFFHYTICVICDRMNLAGTFTEIMKKEGNIGCRKQ